MGSEFVQKWQSQVKKGTLAFILLNILKDNEFYGYEMIEKVRRLTRIEIAEGTLYPLINRLEKRGLVSTKWIEKEFGVPRKYCQLTEEGIETLSEMVGYWNHLDESIQKITNKN